MSDAQWLNFVSLCEKDFEECDFQDELIAACLERDDIAKVVYFHNQRASLKWLKSKVPALDNCTPCKEIEKGNTTAVQNILLSIPY